MSGNAKDVESYQEWVAAMRKADTRPPHKWRLQEMYEATCKYGSGNCWTGTSGQLAAMVRQLLAERILLIDVVEQMAREISD